MGSKGILREDVDTEDPQSAGRRRSRNGDVAFHHRREPRREAPTLQIRVEDLVDPGGIGAQDMGGPAGNRRVGTLERDPGAGDGEIHRRHHRDPQRHADEREGELPGVPPRVAQAREHQDRAGHVHSFAPTRRPRSRRSTRSGGGGRLLAVRGEQKQPPLAGRELAQQRDDPARALRVEVAGRLVREHQGGLVDERPRDRHPLLLSPGEAVRKAALPAREPHPLEHRIDAPAGPAVPAVELERQAQVLLDVEAGNQVEELEHVADSAPSQQGALAFRTGGDVVALEPHRTRVRHVDAADEIEQGGLAAAAPPGDRHELARGEARARVPQHVATNAPFTIRLAQPVDSKHDPFRPRRRHWCHPLPPPPAGRRACTASRAMPRLAARAAQPSG